VALKLGAGEVVLYAHALAEVHIEIEAGDDAALDEDARGRRPPREIEQAALDVDVLRVGDAAERDRPAQDRLERRTVDGYVALHRRVQALSQRHRRLAEMGREIDLLRHESLERDAASDLRLAIVELAAKLVDDEGVLAEGNAA